MKYILGIKFINYYFYILLVFIFYEPIFSSTSIAEVIEVIGEVTIKPTSTNMVKNNAAQGRLVYNGDIITSSYSSKVILQILNTDDKVEIFENSEFSIDCYEKKCFINLYYGEIFTDFSNNDNFILTTNLKELSLNQNQIWIATNNKKEDKIYVINGVGNIISKNGKNINVQEGEFIKFSNNGSSSKDLISEDTVRKEIFSRFQNNLRKKSIDEPFTVMNYFVADPLIKNVFKEDKQQPFHIYMGIGLFNIEKSNYMNLYFQPVFINKNLKIAYNFEGYFSNTDSSQNLNNFNKLSRVLSPLTIEYKSNKGNSFFNFGKLDQITFGYGTLIKDYTNTVSYPAKLDAGFYINYKNNAENLTINFFNSSIEELLNGSGIMGFYSNLKLSKIKSLRIGTGFVFDMNQFYPVPNEQWLIESPRKRLYKGYNFNLTYEISSGLRNDIYLFGEVSILSPPDTLRYIRSELVNWDTSTVEQGFERQSSFGILAPGIFYKLGHHRNFKIAFNYSSPTHIFPYFNETYNLERVRYISKSMIDSIDSNEPFNQDEKWNNMIKKNYLDEDSTGYYLPKDIYMLLNPTQNTYNKIGFYTEYNYNYRNKYGYSIDFSMLNEIGDIDSGKTYYNIGLDFFVKDVMIANISEFEIYFKQNFTEDLFDMQKFNENMIMGFKLGFNISENIYLRIYRHDVFYDNNFDGKVDLNSTLGLGITHKFK